MKDWGVHDSDDSDDDWRGDDRRDPRSRRRGDLSPSAILGFLIMTPGQANMICSPPEQLAPPPNFSLSLPIRPKEHNMDKENEEPAKPVMFSNGRQEEKPGRMKDSADVFGDDTAAPNWSDLPTVENGPTRSVAAPLQELVPIAQDEFVSAPMGAIETFVERNKTNRPSEFEEATRKRSTIRRRRRRLEVSRKRRIPRHRMEPMERRRMHVLLIWTRSSLINSNRPAAAAAPYSERQNRLP